jgi:hypothetical protein
MDIDKLAHQFLSSFLLYHTLRICQAEEILL